MSLWVSACHALVGYALEWLMHCMFRCQLWCLKNIVWSQQGLRGWVAQRGNKVASLIPVDRRLAIVALQQRCLSCSISSQHIRSTQAHRSLIRLSLYSFFWGFCFLFSYYLSFVMTFTKKKSQQPTEGFSFKQDFKWITKRNLKKNVPQVPDLQQFNDKSPSNWCKKTLEWTFSWCYSTIIY